MIKSWLINKLLSKELDLFTQRIREKENEIKNLKERLKLIQWEIAKEKFKNENHRNI